MSVPKKIESVLLVVAMEAEALPIIDKLGLVKDDPCVVSTPTTMATFSGSVGALRVHLAHNGKCGKFGVDKVGTNAATLTTYLAISAFKPTIVISAGTAGGFKARGAEIASIFVSTGIVHHDRRIPLPGFDAFGIGQEEPHNVTKMVRDLGFKEGVVSTGNSLDYTVQCMELMTKHHAAVKEMEAAAVAYVCRLWNTPMFAVKSVTDIVDGEHPPQEEFLANLAKSSQALQEAVVQIVDYMQGKSTTDL